MVQSTLKLINVTNARKFFYLVPKAPRQVNIEVTHRCNLNCKVCKRRSLGLPEVDIPFKKFTSIVDRLPKQVKEVSFGGFGEAFMAKHVYDMIKYVKGKGKKVSITSNGYMFINEANRRKMLDSGLDILRVSIEDIDGSDPFGHRYDQRLLDALGRMVEERKEGNHRTALIFNTIVHKGNIAKVPEIIRYAQSIGFDQVELIHLDRKSNDVYDYLTKDEEIAFYKKVNKMRFKIKVTSLYDRYIGLRKLAFRNNRYCPMTYDVCHITLDGDVTPCCFGLPRYKLGNIFEDSLNKIWNSKKFNDFRKNQKKVCAGCTLFTFT